MSEREPWQLFLQTYHNMKILTLRSSTRLLKRRSHSIMLQIVLARRKFRLSSAAQITRFPVPSLVVIKIPLPSLTLAKSQQQNMKSHSQFTRYLQLQTDVHNEIKLLIMRIGFGTGWGKKGQGQKIYVSKSWQCKVVLPDAKSLFHTLHIKVNTLQHYSSRHV